MTGAGVSPTNLGQLKSEKCDCHLKVAVWLVFVSGFVRWISKFRPPTFTKQTLIWWLTTFHHRIATLSKS
jgi:hypothetical protein